MNGVEAVDKDAVDERVDRAQNRIRAARRSRSSFATATGFAAKHAILFRRKHNVEPAPLSRRAGLSERDFAAGDGNPLSHRVSAVAQARLLDYASEAMHDSAFGLHLAAQADPKDAGIFFYVASGANISNISARR